MSPCLDPAEIEQLVAGELAADLAAAARQHLSGCAQCREAVENEQLFGAFQQLYRAAGSDALERASGSDAGPDDGSAAADAEPGIAGYRIIGELHRGGQGVVYKAIQLATKRLVALKVLLHGALASDRQRRRFEREIDVVAALQHPHIVTIYDSGISNGRYYFAMEYVQGLPLDQHFPRSDGVDKQAPKQRTQNLRNCLRLFGKICTAVGYAHRRGVIHRDLKPNNILIDEDGEPHVVDFGLAKQLDETAADLTFRTATGEFLGTLAYASPEQALGDPQAVDIRSDVYSLGVILYELLTEALPYDVTGSISQTLRNIREQAPLRPSAVSPRIDAEVETIVLKALAKEAERRYPSADALARDIAHYLAGQPIDAKRDSTWYVVKKLLRQHWLSVGTAAAFLLVIVVALATSLSFWWRAVHQRDAAQNAQREANLARGEEALQRQRAEQQRDEAEVQAYAANVVAADLALKAYDSADSWRRLQQAPARRRGWEWHHLAAQLNTSLRRFAGHESYVENVACFHHSPRVASASWDQSVRIWDTEGSGQLARLDLPSHAWSIAVSPQDELLAVGAWDGWLRVWKVDGLEPMFQLQGPTTRVPALAFRPDGEALAVSYGAAQAGDINRVRLVQVGREPQVLLELPQEAPVENLAFGPGGETLATASGSKVQLWRLDDGQLLREFDGHTTVAFHPEGTRIAVAHGPRDARLYDTASGELVSTLRGHTGRVQSVAFHPQGERLATGSRDKTVRIWDGETGRQLGIHLGHSWTITSVDFNRDGTQVLSGGWDRQIYVWDSRRVSASRQRWAAHEGAVLTVAFHPRTSALATAGRDGQIKLWNPLAGKLLRTLEGHSQAVQCLAFAHDGRQLASASHDRTVRLWTLDDSQPPRILTGHTLPVTAVAFAPFGNCLLSGSLDNTLRLWDTETGESLASWQAHDDHVHAVAFSRDGRVFASAGHASIQLWESETRRHLSTLHRDVFENDFTLSFHPDGKWLAAGFDIWQVGFWDVAHRQEAFRLNGHTDEIRALAFSPSGDRLVSASVDTTVRIWDVTNRVALITLENFQNQVHSVCFSPQGSAIAGGMENGEVIVWWASRVTGE